MLDSGSVVTVGQFVPDYELLRCIGRGAYGEVWLARSKATGVLRAAKIVWRRSFDDDRPFQREFEGIQHFERISREHPSQLALFHIGRNDADGYFYYVMELADNLGTATGYRPHTLRADLEQGRLAAKRVLEVGLALTEALGHLHGKGLIHRDVKPSNVIFVNGRPKLADIGLVTDASDSRSIVGTEGYLSPEGLGTPQGDIFALGKVLYEAVTGLDRREFPKLPSDLRFWPDAKEVFELNEILLKACAERVPPCYETCEEMQRELTLLTHGKSVIQRRKRRRHWAAVRNLAAVLATAGALGAAGFGLWREAGTKHPLSKSPEAEALYRQALYERQSESLERVRQAYSKLVSALSLDPAFLDAQYLMAELYFGSFGDDMPPHFNKSANFWDVAEKLRRLSPNSAEFHTVHALALFQDFKFDQAMAEAKVAIKINPGFARAHGLYGYYSLLVLGDSATALQECQTEERLDGADMTLQWAPTLPFIARRDFANAIKQGLRAVEFEPRSAMAHWTLSIAFEAAGDYLDALNEGEKSRLLSGGNPKNVRASYDAFRRALQARGPTGMWEAEVEAAHLEGKAGPYYMACLNARLGHTNEAIELLMCAYTNRDEGVTFLLVDDCWYPQRKDPQFRQLLRDFGFHPVSR